MDRIDVEVEVTDQDLDEYYASWSAMVHGRRRKRKISHLVTDTALAVGLIYVIYRYWSDIHWPTALVVLIMAFYVVGAITIRFTEERTAARPKSNGITLGRRRYTFTRDGILEKSTSHFCQYSWTLVDHLQESENLVVIMLDRAVGIILPRRNLAGTESILGFIKNNAKSASLARE